MGFKLHHFALPDMYGNGVYIIVPGTSATVPTLVPMKAKSQEIGNLFRMEHSSSVNISEYTGVRLD